MSDNMTVFSNSFLMDLIRQAETDIPETSDDLRSMIFTDELTLLPNRRLFERVFSLFQQRQFPTEILKASDSEKQTSLVYSYPVSEPVFFVFCDLDSFKTINDSLGHLLGDCFLCEFARLLQDYFCSVGLFSLKKEIQTEYKWEKNNIDDKICTLRKDQKAMPSSLVARYGGDEFLILSLLRTEKEILALLAEIQNEIKEKNFDFFLEMNLKNELGLNNKLNFDNTIKKQISSAFSTRTRRDFAEKCQFYWNQLTFSFGLAAVNPDCSFFSVFDKADQLMYHQKNSKKKQK